MSERAILHVLQPVVPGGVPDYVGRLVEEQRSRGWKVSVACSEQLDELCGVVRTAGADHFAWEATRMPGASLPGEIRRLGQIVRETAPALVHLHSSAAGLAGRLLLRGRVPTVFQPHGWSFHALDGALRALAVGWERWAARWADEIICVGVGEQQVGTSAGIAARWRVIENGVDLDVFSEAGPGERAGARDRLGLPPDAPIAVCVGRLERAKGQDALVEVWPEVRERVDGALLCLVGDGPDEERLASVAAIGVRVMGRRDDVADWLAAADVVAVPSRWEGMSLAMLEAMARGRSVVSTDVPGAREAIGSDAGAVVEGVGPDFVAALTARLRSAELAAREGRAARRVVERAHDWRRTASAVADAYREILDGRQAAEHGGRPVRNAVVVGDAR